MDWEDVNEQGWCPGKIFEYLAARRPILATGGGEGVIKDLINQTGTGIHAADKQSVKEALLTFYKEYKSNGKISYKGNEEEINKYNQIEMARKFSEVLDSVTG
jgi:glycosyltransferase involved in cell wall biosynthesis